MLGLFEYLLYLTGFNGFLQSEASHNARFIPQDR